MNKRITIILSLIGIILISSVSVSYAIFRTYATQTGTNVVSSTNCLDISISGTNEISLSNAFPIRDSVGITQTPYTFTVTNNCNHYMKVDIGIEVTNSTINAGFIKAAMNKSNEQITPNFLNQYTLVQKPNENAKYIMINDEFDENESKTYEYRMWLDYSVEYGANGVTNADEFNGKIVAIGTLKNQNE